MLRAVPLPLDNFFLLIFHNFLMSAVSSNWPTKMREVRKAELTTVV